MITVIGVADLAGAPVIKDADVVVASPRLLGATDTGGARVVELGGDLASALAAIDPAEEVVVLASGDPGFFGIVRALAERFGRASIRVLPAPSSVSAAFARLAMPWDDAVVVSAHGRPLAEAAALVARAPKAAVLTSPDAPPAVLGAALVDLGAVHAHAAVCSRLGTDEESVVTTDLDGLARGSFDPLSVVVLWSGTGVGDKSLAFGLPEHHYAHRQSMVTKPPVRAAVIGLLALPGPGSTPPVLWDLGTGSGSVAIECASLAPWMSVVAVDRDQEAVDLARSNARDHGVAVRVVLGEAPAALTDLPDPDRVFVGGGGIEVLQAAHARLSPGGVTVATYAALDRAAAAATVLGHLTQITASPGRRLPDGGWRLEGANPVFIAWGTR